MEKRISLVCRVMGEVHEEKYASLWEAKKSGTSATHIINWDTSEVWYPTIYENTWEGDWHIASPKLAAETLHSATKDGLCPFDYDFPKIRRRIEDRLRKGASESELYEIALTLNVKLI